ncbi:RNA-binding protein [Neisseria musculi]|uniref:Lipoprotein n=1 Tax=Neisseria musculi TaxID=1815583 RepID=A0ACD0ZQ55_9NEIS|nr:RNA-binding protein [Neisseria musculi]
MKRGVMVLLCLAAGSCKLMGWYGCDSLSGWCRPQKPAAIDFWKIKGEPYPSIDDYATPLENGSRAIDANAYDAARNAYFYKKIDKFEACGLDWRTRKPLLETFGQEGFDCLEKQGLYRTSLSEDTRW